MEGKADGHGVTTIYNIGGGGDFYFEAIISPNHSHPQGDGGGIFENPVFRKHGEDGPRSDGWIGEQGGLTSTGGRNGEEDRLQMEIPPRVGKIKKTRVKGGSFLFGNIHDEEGRKERGAA